MLSKMFIFPDIMWNSMTFFHQFCQMSKFLWHYVKFPDNSLTLRNFIKFSLTFAWRLWTLSGLPHGYMNFSGHQPDEPTGFSGGIEQQSKCCGYLFGLMLLLLLRPLPLPPPPPPPLPLLPPPPPRQRIRVHSGYCHQLLDLVVGKTSLRSSLLRCCCLGFKLGSFLNIEQ